MATPNQTTEAENTAHSSGTPLDPFAVDFFGGAAPLTDEEDELFEEKVVFGRSRHRPAKKAEWHKNLPQITNAEAEFSNLLSNIPENLSKNAARIIAAALARYTFQSTENVALTVLSVSEVNLNQALSKVNEAPQTFLSIGSQTDDAAAIAALNVDFAGALIDSMLDGPDAESISRRELSPVETTIIEYLAANILREINNLTGETRYFLKNVNAQPAENFDALERGAQAVINIRAGTSNGVINLFAPLRFLKVLDAASTSIVTKKADRKKLSDFEKFARVVDLRLQIGTTFLDADSLLYLEPEDIVLIEQPMFDLQSGGFGGGLQIYAGRSRSFRLRGITENDPSAAVLQFRVEEILSEERRRKVTFAKFKMDEKEIVPETESVLENDAPAALKPRSSRSCRATTRHTPSRS